MPLYDAMKRGIVYARLADPEKDGNNPNIVRSRVIQVLTNGNVGDSMEDLLGKSGSCFSCKK